MAIKLSLSDGPTVIESRRVAELLKFVVKWLWHRCALKRRWHCDPNSFLLIKVCSRNSFTFTRYLTELGGDRSSRLVIGGLLADLSVEHYHLGRYGRQGESRRDDSPGTGKYFHHTDTRAFHQGHDLHSAGYIHRRHARVSQGGALLPMWHEGLHNEHRGMAHRCQSAANFAGCVGPREGCGGEYYGVLENLSARILMARRLYRLPLTFAVVCTRRS